MSMNDTLVIIPAYNEERNISKVLDDIRTLNIDTDVCVINDGSKDKTEEVVQKGSFNVVSLPFNLGYGAALQTGFKYAVLKDYKYVIQFDADGQHDPEDIKLILNELRKGDAEIVIGSRFLGRGSLQIGCMKKVAIAVFRFLIKFFTGTKISDPTSGLKGLTKPVFSFYSNMGRYPVDFPDADILIQMIRFKYRAKEFPANMRIRESGTSMHSGLKPIYYFIKIMFSILIVLLREKFAKEDYVFHE